MLHGDSPVREGGTCQARRHWRMRIPRADVAGTRERIPG
jgi:hypothetical protein